MISVVICTYKRASSLKILLKSIEKQTLTPFEVLIIDGSPDNDTKTMIELEKYNLPLQYWSVPPEERGLTRQRNYGITKINQRATIISFFDDDIILENDYLKLLNNTFDENIDCVGVGGSVTNEMNFVAYNPNLHNSKKWFVLDGFALKLGERHYLRKILGLFPDVPPGILPSFGHAYGAIPGSGKVYEVEHLVGCNMSYSKHVVESIAFSEYFIGYGLYEDLDFSFRATKFGKLYINTNLKLEHHHHPAGRPNTYKYGKMVTRNGWYVWRLKNKNPSIKDRLKWNAISLLLTLILLKSFSKKVAWMEFLGRIEGWFSLIFNPPIVEY